MIANNGYPYVSTYSLTRAAAATQGITLTRASQTIQLSERGDERYDERDDVRHASVASRSASASRSFTPEIASSTSRNADTVVQPRRSAVGASYLLPTATILAPRIIRVGFALNF